MLHTHILAVDTFDIEAEKEKTAACWTPFRNFRISKPLVLVSTESQFRRKTIRTIFSLPRTHPKLQCVFLDKRSREGRTAPS